MPVIIYVSLRVTQFYVIACPGCLQPFFEKKKKKKEEGRGRERRKQEQEGKRREERRRRKEGEERRGEPRRAAGEPGAGPASSIFPPPHPGSFYILR